MYSTKKTFSDKHIISNIEDLLTVRGSLVFERGSGLTIKGDFKIYHPGATDDNSFSEVVSKTVLKRSELDVLKNNNSLQAFSYYIFEDIFYGKEVSFLVQAVNKSTFAREAVIFMETAGTLCTLAAKYNYPQNYVNSLTDSFGNKVSLSEEGYNDLITNGGGEYIHPFEAFPWGNDKFKDNIFEETVFYNLNHEVIKDNPYIFKGNKFYNSKISFQDISGPVYYNTVHFSVLKDITIGFNLYGNEIGNVSLTDYIFEDRVENNTLKNISLNGGVNNEALENRVITAADSNYTITIEDDGTSTLHFENLLAYANKVVWENTNTTAVSRSITNITNSTNDNREYYILVKTAAPNTTLAIKHQDTTNSAFDIIDCIGGEDIILKNGDVLHLIFNEVTNRFLAFNPGKGGFGGNSAITLIKPLHGFVVGDVLNSATNKAMADTEENAEVVGIVSKVIDTNTFELSISGKMDITGLGLATNTTYFLSATVAGALSADDVELPGEVSKPILVTLSPNTAVILNHRGMVMTQPNGGGFAIPVYYSDEEYLGGHDVKVFDGTKWLLFSRNSTPYALDEFGDPVLVSPLAEDGADYWVPVGGSGTGGGTYTPTDVVLSVSGDSVDNSDPLHPKINAVPLNPDGEVDIDLVLNGGLKPTSITNKTPGAEPLTVPVEGGVIATREWMGEEVGNGSIIGVDIPVSLADGKTLGRYENGEIIPSTGKTFEEVLKMIAQEVIKPEISLNTTTATQEYNQTNVTVNLNWSKDIKTLGATLERVTLQRSRNNSTWITILERLDGTDPGSFSEPGLNITADNRPIYYKITIEDSVGGIGTGTTNITFKPYVAPSITIGVGGETREMGDISSIITGTITKNSPNIGLKTYSVQYKANNGSWLNVNAPITITGNTFTYNINHNNPSLVNSDTISYRVEVTDDVGVTTSIARVITFDYMAYFGYNIKPSLTMVDVLSFTDKVLTDGKVRTETGVTTTGGEYTYLIYKAAAGDLTNVVMDDSLPVLGAFSKLSDITGNNNFGATVTLRVYRSNSTNAFTNNKLEFN